MKRLVVVIGLALAVAFGASLALQAQAEKAPGTVILKGSPMGGVKFDHPKHAKAAGASARSVTTRPSLKRRTRRRTRLARTATPRRRPRR